MQVRGGDCAGCGCRGGGVVCVGFVGAGGRGGDGPAMGSDTYLSTVSYDATTFVLCIYLRAAGVSIAPRVRVISCGKNVRLESRTLPRLYTRGR